MVNNKLKNMEMKKVNILYSLIIVLIVSACASSNGKYDASGTFEAVETIISAEANGTLLQFDIHEGQELKASQTVGIIDSTSLVDRKAQLERSKKATLSGRPQTKLQTEALKKELANAILNRDRLKNLVTGGVATQKQLDDANTQVAALEAKIDAQESSLNSTTTSINEQASVIDAQLQEVNNQLAKCKIVNPVDGTILSKYAERYEIAIAGKPLYKIANLSDLIFRAYITGSQLTKIKLNQAVKVYADFGEEKREYDGAVEWISGKSEFTPKTIQTQDERANLVYAVKIAVKNDGYLKIGMYGQIKLLGD